MTAEAPLFVLPELEDEAQNEAFQAHAIDLAEALVNTIGNDVLTRLGNPEAVQPTANSVGAALYLALRASQLQYAEDDPRRKAVRSGFMAAFTLNDEDWKAAVLAEHFRNSDNVGSA